MTILNNFKRRLALFIGANGNTISSTIPSNAPKNSDFYNLFSDRLRPYYDSSSTYSSFGSGSTGILNSTSFSVYSTDNGFINNVKYITDDFNIVDNEYLRPTDNASTINVVVPTRTFANNTEMGKNGLVLKYTNTTEAPITIYGFYAFFSHGGYRYTGTSWEIARELYQEVPLIAVKFDQPVTLEAGKTITTIYDIDFSNI